MRDGLSILWASDGSDDCLESAGIIRPLLAPVASRLHVLTVAPHEGSRFLIQNVLHLNSPPDEPTLVEAGEAADRAVQALGEVRVEVDRSVRWGIAAREIVAVAGELHSDVIVLAMKPHSLVRRMVLGGTGLQVLQSTSVSVLLTRPHPDQQLSAIILLCDTPEYFPAALRQVERLELPAEVRIYLAGFVKPAKLSPGVLPSFSEADRQYHQSTQAERRGTLERLFADATDAFATPGRAVETLIIEDDLEDGLAKVVAEVRPDVVVMGAGPFGTRSFSSTAEAVNVAIQAPCSVLVAR